MKKMNTDEKNILSEFWKDIEMIPIFIDTFDIKHNICRNKSKSIFNSICILFEPKIYCLQRIQDLHLETINIISDIMDIDAKIGVLYWQYITDIFEYYLDRCIDIESYEAAENIRRFLEENKNI